MSTLRHPLPATLPRLGRMRTGLDRRPTNHGATSSHLAPARVSGVGKMIGRPGEKPGGGCAPGQVSLLHAAAITRRLLVYLSLSLLGVGWGWR
jgi:hypothetical protein